jgi:hypothetical protein
MSLSKRLKLVASNLVTPVVAIAFAAASPG